ncbi:MAG: TetR/AcrR family transcriptional regulator [Lachnospiraceae bacterium]|nr:TetR/AcrR family transcriptional regulator [Lachnospiraceae bacterium]
MDIRTRDKVMNAIVEEFKEKGLKFTMDDVANNLHMSKKTLYKFYESKEEMLLDLADYSFADIKRAEREIVDDATLDTVEKIRKIIVVLPDRYKNIGLSNLYQLKDKYPNVYVKVEKYLSTDWDQTIALIEKGMNEGRIRKVSVPVLKAMVESTMAHFMADSGVLKDNGISYEEGLNKLIDIVMDGIRIK